MIPISTFILLLLLLISIALNAFLAFRINQIPKKPHSKELEDFLVDIGRGVGMLAVTRIDPEDVLVRSPRQRQ